MPVQIACPHCNKAFNVKESILGKRVQCTQCQSAFVAQLPGQAVAAASAQAGQHERLTNQQLNQFGIQGNLEKQADIFAATPSAAAAPALGNFAGEDPGFDPGQVYVPNPTETGDNDNPYAAVLNNPAMRSAKKRNKGKSGEAKKLAQAEKIREEHIEQEETLRTWAIVWIFWGALFLVMGVGTVIMSISTGAYFLLIISAIEFLIGGFLIATGIGVRKLTGWGRILGTLVLIPGLSGVPIGTLISASLLYYMWNKKGQMIFSDKYRKTVKLTPHIKHDSILLYILIAIFVVIPILSLLASFFLGGLGLLMMEGPPE